MSTYKPPHRKRYMRFLVYTPESERAGLTQFSTTLDYDDHSLAPTRQKLEREMHERQQRHK